MHHGGRQHLFFQEHPHSPTWGRPQWGHVSSTDLVRWRRHPTALTPSDAGPDRDGCWSGCIRHVDGLPTAFYTGVTGHTDADRVEQVCRATSVDDELDRWEVDPSPVLSGGPGPGGTGFARDPFVWHDDEGWHLLLGVAGGVDHHASPDGRTWRRTGSFWRADDGRHVECPQLLRLPGGDVLVLSVQGGTHEQPELRVVHAVGTASGGHFSGELAGPVEHGDSLYAPAAGQDTDGGWLLWGWVRERVPDEQLSELGRVGALSLPFHCSLDAGRLVLRPVAAVETLRVPAAPAALGRQCEVSARLGPGGALTLRFDDEHIEVRAGAEAVVVDRSRSSRAAWAPREPVRVPIALPVDVRVLLDGSLLTLCVDGRLGAVTRVYPTSPGGASLSSSGDVTASSCWSLVARRRT